jgi:hypothetical protein
MNDGDGMEKEVEKRVEYLKEQRREARKPFFQLNYFTTLKKVITFLFILKPKKKK